MFTDDTREESKKVMIDKIRRELAKLGQSDDVIDKAIEFLNNIGVITLFVDIETEYRIKNADIIKKSPETWSQPNNFEEKQPDFLQNLHNFIESLQNKLQKYPKNIYYDVALLSGVSSVLVKGIAIVAGAATGPASVVGAMAGGVSVVLANYILMQEEENKFKQSLPGANNYGTTEEERKKYKADVMDSLRKRKNNNTEEVESFPDYVAKRIIEKIGVENIFTVKGKPLMEFYKSGNLSYYCDTRGSLHIDRLTEEYKNLPNKNESKLQQQPSNSPRASNNNPPTLNAQNSKKPQIR